MRLRFRIRPHGAGGTPAVERLVEVDVDGRGAVTLGREAGSDIELPFSTVSARHARLVHSLGVWGLTDAGSANGTFFEDRRLRAGEPQVVNPGQAFRLADVDVVFEGASPPSDQPSGKPESTATLARRLVSDLFGTCRPAEVARLVVAGGPDQGKELVLAIAGQSYLVGRAASCHLLLVDDDVSREHASFERSWNGVEVRDLGSKNGVEIDDRRIDEAGRLHDGAVVVVGSTALRLDDPEERYLRQMQAEAPARPTTRIPAQDVAPLALPPVDEGEPPRSLRRAARGPLAIAAVAMAVLAGISGLVLWLLVGSY